MIRRWEQLNIPGYPIRTNQVNVGSLGRYSGCQHFFQGSARSCDNHVVFSGRPHFVHSSGLSEDDRGTMLVIVSIQHVVGYYNSSIHLGYQ